MTEIPMLRRCRIKEQATCAEHQHIPLPLLLGLFETTCHLVQDLGVQNIVYADLACGQEQTFEWHSALADVARPTTSNSGKASSKVAAPS